MQNHRFPGSVSWIGFLEMKQKGHGGSDDRRKGRSEARVMEKTKVINSYYGYYIFKIDGGWHAE